jgi:hypothetical protein
MLPLVVNLPCYPEMPDSELRHLAEEVRACVRPASRAIRQPTIARLEKAK